MEERKACPQVLHVLPYFRPAYGFGGPATVTDLMTARLAADGYQVSVWTSNVLDLKGSKIELASQEPGSVKVRRYGYVLRSLFKATNVIITPMMLIDAIIGPRQFDLIHLHDFRSVQSICALVYARRSGIPLILQPHGTLKIVLGKERLKRFYDRSFGRAVLGYSARVIVLSTAEANEARRAGVPDRKLVVVPNGVPIPGPDAWEAKGAFRRKYRIGKNSFLVLFLGRVRASKGVFLLLDSFATLMKRHPDSALAICGPDDGAEDALRERARRLGSCVVMPGLLTGADKAAAFVDSDAFCLPSPMETQSVAILEAASYGLPLVAGRAAVPPEFVERGAGVFVDLETMSLANGLVQIATSASLRATLGSRARAVVEEYYGIEGQIAAIRNLYDAVLCDGPIE